VAHHGQEVALRAVRRLGLGARRLRLRAGALALAEQPLHLAPGEHLRGDVGAVHDHAWRVPSASVSAWKHHVQVARLERRAGGALEQHRRLAAHPRLPRLPHALDQLVEALPADLGDRLEQRLADHVAVPDQLVVRLVDEVVDLLRPAEDDDEARGAAEHVGQAGPLHLERVEEPLALGVGRLARADVAEVDHDAAHPRVGADVEPGAERREVRLRRRGAPRVHRLAVRPLERRAHHVGERFPQRPPEQRLARRLEQRHGGVVDVDEAPVAVEQVERVDDAPSTASERSRAASTSRRARTCAVTSTTRLTTACTAPAASRSAA
jgi:hypothetical protein